MLEKMLQGSLLIEQRDQNRWSDSTALRIRQSLGRLVHELLDAAALGAVDVGRPPLPLA